MDVNWNVIAPLVISPLMTIVVLLVNKMVGIKTENATNQKTEGDAAESLSNAAKNLIQSYVDEVDRLHKKFLEQDTKLSEQGTKISEQGTKIAEQDSRIFDLETRFNRLFSAYKFVTDKVKDSHPTEVEWAERIRTGEVKL